MSKACRDSRQYWYQRWSQIPFTDIDASIKYMCDECCANPPFRRPMPHFDHSTQPCPNENHCHRHPKPKCHKARSKADRKTICKPELVEYFVLSEDLNAHNCRSCDPPKKKHVHATKMKIPHTDPPHVCEMKRQQNEYLLTGCNFGAVEHAVLPRVKQERIAKRRKNTRWIKQLNDFYQTMADETFQETSPPPPNIQLKKNKDCYMVYDTSEPWVFGGVPVCYHDSTEAFNHYCTHRDISHPAKKTTKKPKKLCDPPPDLKYNLTDKLTRADMRQRFSITENQLMFANSMPKGNKNEKTATTTDTTPPTTDIATPTEDIATPTEDIATPTEDIETPTTDVAEPVI